MMSPLPMTLSFRRSQTPVRSSSFNSLASVAGGGTTSNSSSSILLEFGSSYIRVGYNTFHCPRSILKSSLPFPSHATSKIVSEEEWENVLYPLLSDIYTGALFVKNPKSRRVIVLEPYVAPTAFRVAVCRVLLARLGAANVLFVPGGGLSAVPYGLGSGGKEGDANVGGNKIVVDVGTWECRVVGCAGTNCLMDTVQVVPCGFDSLVQYIMIEHNESQNNKNEEESTNKIPTFEDAKYVVTKCLHHLMPLSSSIFKDNQEEEITIPLQSTTTTSPTVQITISLQLIKQCIHDLYFDIQNPDSLVYAFCSALLSCPIDLRKRMAQNVVMVGGGVCAIPGLEKTFGKALTRLFKRKETMDSKFAPLTTVILKGEGEQMGRGLGIIYPLPFAPHLLSFVGGCIMSTLDLTEERWISKRSFEEQDGKSQNSDTKSVIYDFLQ